MVEDAIRKLLQGGTTTTVEKSSSSSEEAGSNERTIVSVPNIEDLPLVLQLPSVLQPILDHQQNEKENETTEKGEAGPITRARSQSKREEVKE